MAIQWMDGFDQYASVAEMVNGAYARATTSSTGYGPVTTNPRTGTRSFRCGTTGHYIDKGLPVARDTVGVGVAVMLSALPPTSGNSWPYIGFYGGGNLHIAISINNNGAISANFASPTGTLRGASANGVITVGAWHYIEARVYVHDTSGTIDVRVDDVSVLSLTAQDTKNGTATTIDMIRCGGGDQLILDYEDLVIWDNTGTVHNGFLGPVNVHAIRPNADLTATDWVRNTGTADFDAIDDITPDDATTYLEAAAAGNISEFGLSDLPTVTSVVAAQTLVRASNAGLPASMRTSMLQGASVSAGAAQVMPTGYKWTSDVHPVDPATGVAWTPAGINSANLRLERTA